MREPREKMERNVDEKRMLGPSSTYYSLNYSFYFICLAKTEFHVHRQTFASSCMHDGVLRRIPRRHTPAVKCAQNKWKKKQEEVAVERVIVKLKRPPSHRMAVQTCRSAPRSLQPEHRHTQSQIWWFLASVGWMSSNGVRSSYNVIDRKWGTLIRPDASLSCTDVSPTFPLQSHRISEAYIKRFHFLCISRLCYTQTVCTTKANHNRNKFA